MFSLQNELEYRFWRYKNSLFQDGTVNINLSNGLSLNVLCKDRRAYLLSKKQGSQHEKTTLWKKLAVLKPDICLDIGANYGEFSLAITDLKIPTIAIEANPKLIPCLRKTFEQFSHIKILNVAVGNKDCVSVIHFDETYSGTASILKEVPLLSGAWRKRFVAPLKSVKIDQKTIPSILKENNLTHIKSMIVKIDVEGYEEQVFLGLEPLLRDLDWWAAIIEYNPNCYIRANKDQYSLWKLIQNFPSKIVDSRDQHFSPLLLRKEDKLPNTASSKPVDILCGDGFRHLKL